MTRIEDQSQTSLTSFGHDHIASQQIIIAGMQAANNRIGREIKFHRIQISFIEHRLQVKSKFTIRGTQIQMLQQRNRSKPGHRNRRGFCPLNRDMLNRSQV